MPRYTEEAYDLLLDIFDEDVTIDSQKSSIEASLSYDY